MAKKTEGITKSEAIRQAIQAGVDNPTEGVKHIKEKYGLDVKAQVFSTLKSQMAKKSAGKSAKVALKKTSTNGHSANPADLARGVKALVEQFGAEAVRDMTGVFAAN